MDGELEKEVRQKPFSHGGFKTAIILSLAALLIFAFFTFRSHAKGFVKGFNLLSGFDFAETGEELETIGQETMMDLESSYVDYQEFIVPPIEDVEERYEALTDVANQLTEIIESQSEE